MRLVFTGSRVRKRPCQGVALLAMRPTFVGTPIRAEQAKIVGPDRAETPLEGIFYRVWVARRAATPLTPQESFLMARQK